jgi:hypothetical protein
MCQSGVVTQPLKQAGAFNMTIKTIGIDLAKNFFKFMVLMSTVNLYLKNNYG